MLTNVPASRQLIAFTHLPKTAGTALHHILRRTYGTRYLVVAKEDSLGKPLTAARLQRIRRGYPGLRAFGGHLVLPSAELQLHGGLRFMTMLREPAARCASHYAHERARFGTTTPFPEWITQDRLRSVQARRFSQPVDAEVAISVLEEKFFFVGLSDEFAESLQLLRYDMPELAVPPHEVRRNLSRSERIKAEVLADPAALAAIEETQSEDIKLYAYIKNTMWPKFRGRIPAPVVPVHSEMLSEGRARLSHFKERLLRGVPRRLGRSITAAQPEP